MTEFRRWQEKINDKDLLNDIEEIKGDKEKIKEQFSCDLEFGTAGIRGIMGVGTNRMNTYVVAKITQAWAIYLNKKYTNPKIAIAYDSRINNKLFARTVAQVLAANNIKSYIFKELAPTPTLAFSVRHLKLSGGVVITASHNPSQYNGYKIYEADGGQIRNDGIKAITEILKNLDIFDDVKKISFEDGIKSGKIEYIEDDLKKDYIKEVLRTRILKNVYIKGNLKVGYTPLNGAGSDYVLSMFKSVGIKDVMTVKEQLYPDGNFTTCKYPNPEFKEAMELGINLLENNNLDILVATDPDSDRVGVAIKTKEGFEILSGNQVGILMFSYICKIRKECGIMHRRPIAVKTIVSSKMIDKIAEKYNVELKSVLTGFKYIANELSILDKKNELARYIFGYEESIGYLINPNIWDKDGVIGAMIICEIASFYKRKGKTLEDVLNELYNEYGYYNEKTLNFKFDGFDAQEKMKNIMQEIRENTPKEIGGFGVIRFADYLNQLNTQNGVTTKMDMLPKSNIIEFGLENSINIIIRPSGTEPKIKVYMSICSKEKDDSYVKMNNIIKYIKNYFKN